ncbi:MAG TPA: DUF6084 family protein [Gaiellales bacterium]|nr:DUF6084 family protein [Gaiellales bacterium]
MSSAREAEGLPPAPAGGQATITPEFAVLGAEVVEDAVAPTLRFRLGVSEPSGREIFTIALTAQINVEPARRDHDAATRERLVDLFGEPERWPATTHPFLWAQATTLVPTFTGAGMFTLPVPSTFDLEVSAARYFSSLDDGEAPLAFHFSGSILLRGEDGRIQVVSVPWSCSTTWRMPIATWRSMMQRHYPCRSWVALQADTVERLTQYRRDHGLHSFGACVERMLDRDSEEVAGE